MAICPNWLYDRQQRLEFKRRFGKYLVCSKLVKKLTKRIAKKQMRSMIKGHQQLLFFY